MATGCLWLYNTLLWQMFCGIIDFIYLNRENPGVIPAQDRNFWCFVWPTLLFLNIYSKKYLEKLFWFSFCVYFQTVPGWHDFIIKPHNMSQTYNISATSPGCSVTSSQLKVTKKSQVYGMMFSLLFHNINIIVLALTFPNSIWLISSLTSMMTWTT